MGSDQLVEPQSNILAPYKIQTLTSGRHGVVLSVSTPSYSLEPVTLGARLYSNLTFSGSEAWAEPGNPQLPFISGLIGVPPEAEVTLQISADAQTLLPGEYVLPPAPRLVPGEEDFQVGQQIYESDPAVYALDEWLPAEPVQVDGDAWLRDQRVMRVSFFPFQYNPARQAIRWSPELRATITFAGGQSSLSGVESPFEDLLSNSLLNYDAARTFRGALSTEIQSPSQVEYVSLGNRFDIKVNHDGVYRLSYVALQAAGMDVDNIDPTTFHLYSQGEDIAIYVFGEADGSFDPTDYVTFYGEKFKGDILAERYQALMAPENGQAANNWFWQCAPQACDLAGLFEQYTDDNVYSLTVGGEPGPRMSTVDGTPSGGTIPSVYTTTVRAEQSNYWWAYEFHSEDVWYWSQISRPTASLPYTTTYPINLTNVAPGYPATLHAEVASRNSTSGYPDHHTRFKLNAGTAILDDAYWDGSIRYEFTATIPTNNVLEGTNNLLFGMFPDVSVGTTRMYFDFFEITYSRLFVALADQLSFTRYAPGTWKYEISGFTSPSVEVYDITNPFLPVRVLNPGVTGSNPYTASYRTTDGTSASYYVAGSNSLQSPVEIIHYQPPDFAAMQEADYLFITHEAFIPSLQTLAAYRASQGLSVAIVDVDDLYREFNDGIYHPIAIKNFLAYTFENWENPPTYVALVGSGHWNFKNLGAPTEPYKNPPPIYMPPNLAHIDPWQGQTDSANLLATLVGEDTIPDLYISRIPVSSSAELDVLIGKIIAYEAQPIEDWQRNITFIADNTPDPAGAGDFIALAEAIINDYIDPDPYYSPIRIYENDFGCTTANTPQCDAVTQAIVDTSNITGTLLVNYIGHGSLNRWSGESIFLNADVGSLNNADQLPIILSMTCLDGYWLYPNVDSLARVFLTSSGKGAVATYSPTGLGVATGHDALQRGFFDSLVVDGQWKLGQAALQGKIWLYETESNYDLMHTFTVFGDPALHITTPYDVALTPDAATQSAPAGQTVTYTLQLSNPGLVTDTYSVTLSGNVWDTSLTSSLIGPLAPGESHPVTVTVNISPEALGNQTDTAIVLAKSLQDQDKTISASLMTTALTEGIELAPYSQTGNGAPGSTVTYTFNLTNTSVVTDTFTLSLANNVWETDLSGTSMPLSPGTGTTFEVVVHIPSVALGNDFDQVTVTAQSTLDPSHVALAFATTTAVTDGFSLLPTQASSAGYGLMQLSYNLQVTNHLNTAEYYAVTLDGNTWPVSAPVAVGPANPGALVNFIVNVTVPLTATVGLEDVVTVTVAMLDDPNTYATSVLTSTSLGPAFSLTPMQAGLTGETGSVVQYDLQVTNLMETATSFTVALSGQTWETSAQTFVGPLNPGDSLTIPVSVTIPLTATTGMTDTVTVLVALPEYSNVQLPSSLTTTALASSQGYFIYIPLVVRP
ncbi:MAG TPA: C25 family cysteine peptidase [Anaerolineales bacterium]|nr:C25 family cysteine peptidase [Anaerolineales bacterium]